MAQAVRDIRRRIRAIKNTQQITRAMQMVAASKLRKAQGKALSARTYTEKLAGLLHRLTADGAHLGNPLLIPRPVERVTLIVITADRGLAGSYNANLFRRTEEVLARLARGDSPPEVELIAVGRKGRDYLRRRGFTLLREDIGVSDDELHDLARRIARRLTESFIDGITDEVIVIYSRFVSVLSQRPDEIRLLPAIRSGDTVVGLAVAAIRPGAPFSDEDDLEYIYQPDARTAYSGLLPKHIVNQLFQALLEARASDYGARMTAMHSATENASEMIEKLTLDMNRARQASITQEIMELVGGANALKQA